MVDVIILSNIQLTGRSKSGFLRSDYAYIEIYMVNSGSRYVRNEFSHHSVVVLSSQTTGTSCSSESGK